jgi:hypothetical protein
VRYPSEVRRIAVARPVEGIWKGSRFSHQSALISRELQKAQPYNENNPICADYEFFYRAYVGRRRFLKVPVTMASIESGGISDRKRFSSILGRWRVIDKSPGRAAYYAGILFLEFAKWPVRRLVGLAGRLMSRDRIRV